MTIIPTRGYSPAPTCHGWTCPCGHHSISAVGPVPACARCDAKKPGKPYVPYVVRQARKRNRYLRLIEEAQKSLAIVDELMKEVAG